MHQYGEIHVHAGIGQSSVDYIDELPFTRVLTVFVDEGKKIWLLFGLPIEFERLFCFYCRHDLAEPLKKRAVSIRKKVKTPRSNSVSRFIC